MGDALKRRALLVFAMSAAVLAGCAAEPPVSAQVQSYYDSHKTLAPSATATAAALPKIDAGPGTKTVILGDSWASGYAAKPATLGYAYITGNALGWDYKVDAVSGTGFLNPGPANTGTYGDRLKAMPVDPSVKLLIIQGGLNDAATQLKGDLQAAIIAGLASAKVTFPSAQIVLLGPTPPILPASVELTQVNATYRGVAEAQGIHFISPVDEVWLRQESYSSYMDPNSSNHPNTAGHAYFGQKLADAIRKISN